MALDDLKHALQKGLADMTIALQAHESAISAIRNNVERHGHILEGNGQQGLVKDMVEIQAERRQMLDFIGELKLAQRWATWWIVTSMVGLLFTVCGTVLGGLILWKLTN